MNQLLAIVLLLVIGLSWQSASGSADEENAADEGSAQSDTAENTEGDAEDEKSGDKGAEEDFDKRLDALLSEVTAADAYGDPIHCLHNRKYRHIDVISQDMLLFSRGNKYWVNELKRTCVGLSRDMVMHTVIKGINSLCENDLVFANRRFDMDRGLTSSGRPLVVRATCALGEFKPIDEVYAQSLREMAR